MTRCPTALVSIGKRWENGDSYATEISENLEGNLAIPSKADDPDRKVQNKMPKAWFM